MTLTGDNSGVSMTYGQMIAAAAFAWPLVFIASMTNRYAAVVWALTFQPVLFGLAYVFTSIVVMLPIMLLNGGSVPSFAGEVGMIAGFAGAAIAFVHGVRWLVKGMPGYPCMVPVPPFNPMD